MVRFTHHSGCSGSKAYVYCQSCQGTKTNFGNMFDLSIYTLLVNQLVQAKNLFLISYVLKRMEQQ